MKPQTLPLIPKRRSAPLRYRRLKHSVRGALLIEVLVAVLILAFGILGIVGLQAKMTTNMTDARYRAEAAFLVDQLIGLMWSDAHGGYAGEGASKLTDYKANDSVAATPDALGDPSTCGDLSAGMGGASSTVFRGWYGDATNPSPGTVVDLLPKPRVQVIVNKINSNENIDRIDRIVSQIVTVRLCWSAPNDIDAAGNGIWHHHRVTTQILG